MRNHDLKHLPVAIVSTWRAERLWSESPFGGPVSHWCAGDGSFCIFGFSSFWVKQIKHVNEDRLTFLFSSDSASRIGAFPLSFDETGWVRVEVGKIGYSFIPECIKIASTVGWVSVPGWSVIFRLVVPELFFLSSLDLHPLLSLVSSTVIWIPFHRIVRVLNTIIRKCRKDRIDSDPLTLRARKERRTRFR